MVNRSNFFEYCCGARLRNKRWSLGAISPSTGHVYLAGRSDNFQTMNGRPCVRILDVNNPSPSHGYPERQQHIRHIQEGSQALSAKVATQPNFLMPTSELEAKDRAAGLEEYARPESRITELSASVRTEKQVSRQVGINLELMRLQTNRDALRTSL